MGMGFVANKVFKMSETWNDNQLSNRFQFCAEKAEQYLRELPDKIRRNSSYERIYDETLAEYYVYNYLHGKTFLSSRFTLLRELREMKMQNIPMREKRGEDSFGQVYNAEGFSDSRLRLIDSLISEFQ